MNYATLENYKDYLGERPAKISDEEFGYYIEKASNLIDFHTYNRLADEEVYAENAEALILCSLELAEAIHFHETSNGDITGEKVGDYSVSYSNKHVKAPSTLYREIIWQRLSWTELVYRGV